MAINLNGFVTWLKGWFYTKEEVNTIANSKLNANLTTANKNVVTNGSGDVVLEDKPVIPDVSGKIDTAGTGLSKSGTTLNHSNSITAQTSHVFKKITYDGQGHITGTALVKGEDLPSHEHYIEDIIDDNVYINISSTGTLDSTLDSIDTAIGDLQSIKAIEVVSSLPTASVDTMGKLYIISENSKINVYYTTVNKVESTYDWHKMDADILDELSIDWSEIENKPSTFTPSSHTHGNITNDGILFADGAVRPNLLVCTNSSGLITGAGQVPTTFLYDISTLSNIGTDDGTSQKDVNIAIDTAIGNLKNLIDAKQEITSIVLVPKNDDANGKIIFYTGDEPT